MCTKCSTGAGAASDDLSDDGLPELERKKEELERTSSNGRVRHDDVRGVLRHYHSRRSSGTRRTLRYARGEEFLDVVFGLWDSWEDDALLLDNEQD